MDFVKFCYKRLYGNDYGERFEVVETKLKDLYEEYKKKIEKECNNEASGSKELDCDDSFMGPYLLECVDVMEEFDIYRNSEFSESSHNSDLKLYLEDGLLDRKLPLDILSFWQSQQRKYPILSLMEKDVLAVPITTVASESAFSIGGRFLDEYRSSLKDDIVEALLCTRDWLYGNAIATEEDQENEDISKFHIDTEQFTLVSTPSLDNVRFASITMALLSVIFLAANFIPSIWDAFQIMGATTAVCIGFIFPAAITLRDSHGIASKTNRVISVFMIFMAVVTNAVAVYSDFAALLDKNKAIPQS